MLQHRCMITMQNLEWVGRLLLHTRHDILQMLLFQTSCNYTTCLASALLRLVRIVIISAANYWGVPVTVIRLHAIAIKVGRPRKAIAHTKIGLLAATRARRTIEERDSLNKTSLGEKKRRTKGVNLKKLTLVLWLGTVLAYRKVAISASLENISSVLEELARFVVIVIFLDWSASKSPKTAIALH